MVFECKVYVAFSEVEFDQAVNVRLGRIVSGIEGLTLMCRRHLPQSSLPSGFLRR